MIYTTTMLLEQNQGYSNGFNKIQRDCKSGKIIKLMRGLYESNPCVPPYLCSGYILSPSYISFDYVLSQHGLIPEYVPNITCASFKKKKVKRYDTPIGVFIYRDVPPEVFPFAIEARIEEGYSYVIATVEKALCDKLYSVQQKYSYDDFTRLLFDDLRIDKGNLDALDWNVIKSLASKYNKNNLNLLLKYYQKEVCDE